MVLRQEIAQCWRKYEARNTDLAHLAANILILLASVWGAELIAGKSLKSLKSEGRGRGVKGRWVHWRNNSQADPGSAVAHAALQMPPEWDAPGLAAPQRHDAHVSEVRPASAYLCLACSGRQRA